MLKRKRILQCPAGEMAGHIRKRFLLYPDFEIANFQQGDRDNSNAHSVFMYIMLKGQPMCTLIRCIYSSVRILFLRSFLRGVWRCPMLMSRTSLTLSFYSYFCLTADFGDL